MKGQRSTTYKDQENRERRELHSPFPIVGCKDMTQNYTNLVGRILRGLGDGSIFDIDSTICPNLNTIHQGYVQGSRFKLPFTKLVYTVYPCSLEDRSQCASPSQLGRAQLVTAVLSNSMDLKNFSRPIRDGFDTDLTPVFGLNTHAKFTIWLKNNKIFNQKDLPTQFRTGPSKTFFSIDKIDSTTGTRDLSTHCTDLAIEDGSCMPYVTIEFRASKWETVIERRYYRMFDFISDIGGMIDLILYSLWGVYALYRVKKYKEWVILQYFGSLIKSTNSSSINNKKQPKRSLQAKTERLLKYKQYRQKAISKLMKKMDALTFLAYSQKSYILNLTTANYYL